MSIHQQPHPPHHGRNTMKYRKLQSYVPFMCVCEKINEMNLHRSDDLALKIFIVHQKEHIQASNENVGTYSIPFSYTLYYFLENSIPNAYVYDEHEQSVQCLSGDL